MEMDPAVLAELKGLMPQVKTWMDKYASEASILGKATKETSEQLQKMQDQVDKLDQKLASNLFTDSATKPWQEEFTASEDLNRMFQAKRGHARIELNQKQVDLLFNQKTKFPGLEKKVDGANVELKTTITNAAVGYATSGVLQIDRQAGITREARETLQVRDLFQVKPTTMPYVDWIKIASPMSIASPVSETSQKPFSQLTFTTVSEKVKLLAILIPASRQVLDDFTVLLSEINDQMTYYTGLAMDQGYLFGDGTGENLHGVFTQAASFSSSLLVPAKGWTKIDVIYRTIQQIRRTKEVPPTWVILHPDDLADMRLTKDSFGRYIMGDPNSNQALTLWGLDVVETTTMPSGSFLVGSGNPAAAGIRDRMGMVIDISTEDGTNFQTNLVTIRCELRTLMMVRRPNAFVAGTFTTSP